MCFFIDGTVLRISCLVLGCYGGYLFAGNVRGRLFRATIPIILTFGQVRLEFGYG